MHARPITHGCSEGSVFELDAQGNVVSAGGRVLCVAALGDSVRDAQANAYAGVAEVSWANEFHRNDIGWRAIARKLQKN